jgi:ribonuclease HII
MLQKPLRVSPKSEKERLAQLVEIENSLHRQGYQRVAGVDEAGRGPLAGPVVASACCIPEGVVFAGIDDSKCLSRKERQRLFTLLTTYPGVVYGIGSADHLEIDLFNILQATLQAMKRAVDQLPAPPDYLLVDGQHLFSTAIPAQALIKGDRRAQAIAAASILAKETRDRLMEHYDTLYPPYGFLHHKGYPTASHRAAIAQHGLSPIHRLSFTKKLEESNLSLSIRNN